MQVRGQRLAPLSVIARAPGPATPARPLTGALLALPTGNVAGSVRPVTVSRDRRSATYELIVANETEAPVATFAYAAGRLRPGQMMTWNAITVPPLSAIAIAIDVPLSPRHAPQRLVAELHGPDAQLTLDAEPPKLHPPGRARRVALMAAAAMLLAAGAAALAAGRPRVVALAAPQNARVGQPFSVAYVVGAGSEAAFSVTTSDGLEIRRASLAHESGAFSVTLPGATAGYDIRVFARNGLGTDVRVAHVLALAPPITAAPAPRARISSLSVASDVVRGGESIVVQYAASASAGSVKLIDQDGTVRAEALMTRRGSSIVVAPRVEVDEDFRVVLHVSRGNTQAEAAVPVRILRAPAAATGDPAANAPASANGDAMAGSAAGAPDPSNGTARSVAMQPSGPIAVPKAEFFAGDKIPVPILRHEAALHVALDGPGGEELQGVDVNAAQTSVTLTAPAAGANSRFSIVATFTSRLGQETVVQPIVVHRAP